MFLFCLLFTITGCNQNNTTTKQNEVKVVHSDGRAILFANGKEYIAVRDAEDNEFTIDKKVGVIEEKVPLSITPSNDFSSNSLEVGTEIYSVKDNKDILLAKTTQNDFIVYIGVTKSPSN